MPDRFEQRLAEDFFQFVKGNLDDEEVKVFLCGQGLDETHKIEDQTDSNIRAFLKVKIEEQVKGCKVTLAEHKNLIDAYSRAIGEGDGPKYSNLTDYELQLAHWADLIVILPSSAGSIAELGMFAVSKQIAPKLLIFFDQTYGLKSYIWNGPIRAATGPTRGARVVVTEYKNIDQILDTVIHRVRDEKSTKRSNKLLAGER
jgi:hypothetical protein